jgi:hypothetical protein
VPIGIDRDGTTFAFDGELARVPNVSALRHAELVRLQDSLISNLNPWRLNPRTGYLESRAGLSWTGVRDYRTASGVIRVLHRPEQFRSASFLRTLRLMPLGDGHPPADVSITAANDSELRVGSTGDKIDVETLDGYERPVGNLSVSRPSTMVKMVDEATWREACELIPDLTQYQHSGERPRTGTSLGYLALWLSPFVDSEIVDETEEGLVGQWMGPKGPELYDCEHVVDVECEQVQRLVREADFDPSALGANHLAVALQRLGGRGAEQSELVRVVDSQTIPISADRSRVLIAVPLQQTRHVQDEPAGTDHGTDVEPPAVAEQPGNTMTTPANIEVPARIIERIPLTLTRDSVLALTKRGKSAPTPVEITCDEVDAPKLRAWLTELGASVQEMLAMLGEAEELPLRVEKIERIRKQAIKFGADAAKVAAATDEIEIQRLALSSQPKVGNRYEKASSDAVRGAFDMLALSAEDKDETEAEASAARAGDENKGAGQASPLSLVPLVKPGDKPTHDAADPKAVKEPSLLDTCNTFTMGKPR